MLLSRPSRRTSSRSSRSRRSSRSCSRRDDASTVAGNDMDAALYGDTPLGRNPTPESVAAITLDDVKSVLRKTYFRPEGRDPGHRRRRDASRRARRWPRSCIDGWQTPASRRRPIAYDVPDAAGEAEDHARRPPGGEEAVVRMGIPAYDIKTRREVRRLASPGQILTSGIDSRLEPVRAGREGPEPTASTACSSPSRHGGAFVAGTDTAVEPPPTPSRRSSRCSNDMRTEPTSRRRSWPRPRSRVAGGMVMSMQTIQPAGRRSAVDAHPERLPDRLLRQVPRAHRRGDADADPRGDEEVRQGRRDGRSSSSPRPTR